MNSQSIQITCFDDSEQNNFKQAMDAWQKFLQKVEKFFVYYLQPKLADIAKQSEFHLIVIDEEQMIELNNRFRRANYPTDVLTFRDVSQTESSSTDQLEPVEKSEEEKTQVDIFICLQVAMQQAAQQNIPLEYELTLLSLHGLLHGVGLDHEESDNDAKEMNRLERVMLSLLQIPESVALTKI